MLLTPIALADNVQTISDIANESVLLVTDGEVVSVSEEFVGVENETLVEDDETLVVVNETLIEENGVLVDVNETINETEIVLEIVEEDGFLTGLNNQYLALFAVLLLILAVYIYTTFSISYLITKADRLHRKADRLDNKGKFLKATRMRKKADKVLDKTWK